MTPDPLRLFGLTEVLFAPIHKLIEQVLPKFLADDLRSEDVRARIVTEVDRGLVTRYPAAALVPQDVRARIIRRLLDTVLDEILLGREAA